MTIAEKRGVGTTTRQMREAPQGAHFVWCNNVLFYPKSLAEKIGRTDLKIVAPEFFKHDAWRGVEFKAIILDHWTVLPDREWDNFNRAIVSIRRSTKDSGH